MDDDCVIISKLLPATAIPTSRLSYDRQNCYRISFRKSYFKSKRKIIAYYPLKKKVIIEVQQVAGGCVLCSKMAAARTAHNRVITRDWSPRAGNCQVT